jgi:hypothetical protein
VHLALGNRSIDTTMVSARSKIFLFYLCLGGGLTSVSCRFGKEIGLPILLLGTSLYLKKNCGIEVYVKRPPYKKIEIIFAIISAMFMILTPALSIRWLGIFVGLFAVGPSLYMDLRNFAGRRVVDDDLL